MPASPNDRVYCGNIITPHNGVSFVAIERGYLIVGGDGRIKHVSQKLPPSYARKPVTDFGHKYILPGLIDLHTHLSQFTFAGIGGETLLSWLQKYTFPHESRFLNTKFARAEAKHFFRSCLQNGTTTVVAYVTSHGDATDVAFEAAKESGMRAYLGQVLMNANSPKALSYDRKTAIASCERLIKDWHNKGNLQFIVSPRFALSCTREMLEDAARLAKKHKLFLQTHLAESEDEIAAVRKFHPWAKNYTDVYLRTGCLGRRSLLGHCIHLSKQELNAIKKTRSVIVHCPTSNRFLASGAMPLRRYQEMGLRLGFGSDVAGGYDLSMFHETKEAIETSKQFGNPFSIMEAFRLATIGGAKALGREEDLGSLEVGKQADFIVVDDALCHPHGRAKSSLYTSPFEALARFLYRGHPRMVDAVYVSGKLVL